MLHQQVAQSGLATRPFPWEHDVGATILDGRVKPFLWIGEGTVDGIPAKEGIPCCNRAHVLPAICRVEDATKFGDGIWIVQYLPENRTDVQGSGPETE